MTSRSAAGQRSAWAPSRTAAPDRPQLWCFPYAGAGTSVYRSWDASLGSCVDVQSIELPGRGTRFRERPFTRLRPLVERLAEEMEPRLSVPFALFGHSVGALVAFEIASERRRAGGAQPSHLFVSGCPPPERRGGRERLLHALPDAEFIAAVSRLGGIPSEVLENDELLALVLPPLRADFELSETYAFTEEAPLSCGISVFSGREDVAIDVDGWRRHTSGPFSARIVDGDHFFIRASSDVLMAAVVEDLARYVA